MGDFVAQGQRWWTKIQWYWYFPPEFFDEKSYTETKLLNGSVDIGRHFVDDHTAKSLTNTTSLVSYFVSFNSNIRLWDLNLPETRSVSVLHFKIYRSFFHTINRKRCALYLHLMRKTICRKDSVYEDVKTLRTQITVAWLTVNTTVYSSFVLIVWRLWQRAIHSKCKWEGFRMWSGNVWAECTGSFSS